MPPSIYFATLGLFVGTILLVFAMKYGASTFNARASAAREEAYRALTERLAAAQAEQVLTLGAIRGELAQLSGGVGAIERILKQVE